MADNASSKAFDYAAKNVIDLARVEAGSVSKVKTFLSGLESDLVKILNDNKDLSPGKKAKLETILKAAGSAIDSTYQAIGKQHAGDMAGLAKAQSAAAGKMLNHAIGVDVFGAVLTESQLASVAGDTAVFGHSSGDWWASQSSQLRFKFAGQMKQGYALGEDVDALVRRVRGTKAGQFKDGIMQASRREAEALVRSSIQTISNEARLKSFAALGDTIKGIEWVATLDTRTTVICRALDGLVWTVPDLKPVGHAKVFPGPTAHWNCFVEDIPVESAGTPQASYRRRYTGRIITIETTAGRRIQATPNHPVLTLRGWVAVESLKQGDQLVCKRRSGRRFATVGPDNDERVSFADFHKAFSELHGVDTVEMPVSRPDFHGDGTDGEIGEVATNRKLLIDDESTFAKASSDFVFERPDLQMSFAPGDGHSPEAFFGPGAAAQSTMGGRNAGLESACVSGDNIFGSGPGDPGPLGPSVDRYNRDTELCGNFTGGELVFDVELDSVSVVLRREAVSVWVHNLETETGWYFADGIASHNCRSTQIPVLRSWAELSGKPIKALDGQTMEAKLKAKLAAKGMSADKIAMATANARASMDGQVSGSPDMEAWLKSKPDSFIKGVLGPTRAKMLAEGKITIADLTDQNNRPLTIAELQAAIDGGGFAVETEGVDFEPFDKSKLKGFNDADAAAAQDAAKAKIAAVLADPKAAGNSILSANLAKIQAAEPSLTPAELLAKAEEATAAKIAANTKSSILSKAKKKMLAGEEPTPAQKALIDDLGEDEKAAFLESVADAKTAKQITEANAAATAKLTSWSADPIKQKAIDKALADGATADKPLELAAAADKALGDLVAGETAGNQLAAAKKAMKALTGMNAPTPASVQAWLKQQGKDPAEFLAEFQAVTKEKADQSVKSSVLSKAKKKLAAGQPMTPAQQKIFNDLLPEEQASFNDDVEAMKAKAGPDPAALAAAQLAADEAAQKAAQAAAAKTAAEAKAIAAQAAQAASTAQATVPHPDQLKIVKTLGGSTGAQLAEDADGNRYVVKRGAEPDHVRTEFLADELYRAMGHNVPEGGLFETKSGPVKVTRFLDGGVPLASLTGKAREDAFAKIHQGFASDVLMANWDVAGTGLDNVMVTPDGKVWRIDNGGSLQYRAQGSLVGKNWDRFPDELWTMRDKANISGPIFGSMDTLTVARQIESANLEAVLKVPMPDDTRKVLEGRIQEMRHLATRAIDFDHDGYTADHTEKVVVSTLELRKAGISDTMPKALTPTSSSSPYIMTDQNGRSFGNLRTSHNSAGVQVVKKIAGDVYSDDILIASKALAAAANVQKDLSQGSAMTKSITALAHKPALEKLAKQPGEAGDMAKAYLKQLDEIDKLVKAGGIPAAPPPMFKPAEPAAVPGQAAAQVNTGSVVEQWEKLMASEGIDVTPIRKWMASQSGNSWSPETQAMKVGFAKGFADPEASFYWDGNNIKASWASAQKHYKAAVATAGGQAKFDRMMTSWHALTQEVISEIDAPWIDRKRRAVLLYRTVSNEELDGSHDGLKVNPSWSKKSDPSNRDPNKYLDGEFIPKRGTTESHSIYKKTFVKGGVTTVQAVPFSRILATYWTEQPGVRGRSGFLTDGEAEFAANTSGIKARKVTKFADPAADEKSKDATNWNVPLDNIRTTP